ncbi:MAG TPA: HAMP domain-containing sensor histidine kinase [Ilumatobacteraceae bacterium]|nr:HAMP domain-containing sensor histidine kinase [Ilumatobacteraceae bacterium]
MTVTTDSVASQPRRGLVRGAVGLFANWRPARFGLRTRIMSMFIVGALLLSTFLAAVAYSFTRSSLLNQRERSSTEQAYRDASIVQREISTGNTSANTIIDRLQQVGVGQLAINIDGAWASPSAKFTSDVIPASMQTRVINDRVPAKMIIRFNKVPTLVIGIPLEESDASYFEFADLADANTTLRNVGLSLLFGGLITTLAGAVTGMLAAKRAIRPLGDAAQAAKAIAGGRLDTRLENTDDHDLQLLSTAFNDMAEALQNRVERDARFASDVSHELRSPLMTLAASVEVMQARRDDMPDRAQAALDLLVGDVARFQGLVEDLLEISRFDAGAIRLHLEDLLVAEFVRQAVAVSSMPTTKVTVSERAEGLIMRGDRRRLARVVANLIDNARVHGGGEPAIIVSEAEGEGEPLAHVWIAVEDHGPGIPNEERSLVFERFARGAVAGRRSSSDGAGLGLALVDEHVRMHGGRVWVEDRPDGETGARFVLELPAEEVAIG